MFISISRKATAILFTIHCSLFVNPVGALAQTDVTSSWQVGVGGTRILDTYLSQEKFSGTGITILNSSERQRPNKHWAMLTEHELNLATAADRADKREELEGSYTLFVGGLRQWCFGPLRLQGGAMGAVDVGFTYNTSNSNNPAQGRLSLQLTPTGTAAYAFKLWRRPLQLRYELQLPLAGVMFSPNYGQSYYEIFSLGNYDHNVVMTTFVSAPTWRQQLSAEYPIGRGTSLHVSYLGHYQQSNVNHLKTHIYHDRVMIGIVRKLRILNVK
jgi:hypothetical protein